MKHYIAVKMVEAKPMTYAEHTGNASDEPTPGYRVVYPDGYRSWSPKEAFDASHLELDDPTKINESDLTRFLGPTAYEIGQLDEKTTVVRMTDRTGFVQYDTSSCVDPANFDPQIGADICIKRLKDKVWPMLGFVLQWAKYGLKPMGEITAPNKEGDTPDAVSPQPVQ